MALAGGRLRSLFWCLLLATAVWLPGPIHAQIVPDQSDDLFTVRKVPVDVTADTAAAASVRALADGERLALQRLLERLTSRADAKRWPRPDDAQLASLVRALEVADERTSTVRYLANLTVHFNRQAVRRMLNEAGIGLVSARARPVIVLPVYRLAGTSSLWEDPNPWRATWAGHPPGGGLAPVVVPIGDLDDVAAINAAQALAGDGQRLEAIARRYGAEGTVVAVATLAIDQDNGMPRLDLSVTRYSGGRDSTTVTSLTGVNRDTVAPLLDRGVDQVLSDLDEAWKADNALQSAGEEQRLVATVGYEGVTEWLELRRRLGQIAAVRRVDIVQFGPHEARLNITFFGENAQLRQLIAQAGIESLEREEDLQLRLAPGASSLSASGGGAPATIPVQKP
ncbi:MAG: DUF2066 domain-containing protein [Proteobacteria bacterium]|nr:DUF2066 domain-containing protein [Pseudomonadota bacterium]MBI3495817.1 DUF2066 domain-containing protein [Pseudomonadota bacterium]